MADALKLAAMLGVAALAACGAAAPLPKPLQQLTVLLAGVGKGSGHTPATLPTLARYPFSLVALVFAVAGMMAASYFTLLRVSRQHQRFTPRCRARCPTSFSPHRARRPISRGSR